MNQQESDFNIINNIRKYFIKVAVLVAGTATFFYGCESNIEKIKPFNTEENLPVLEARDFETLFTDSGKVRFFMKTPLLLRFEPEGNPYHEFPEGIELIKYDDNQNVISSITANYAKQFVEEKKWEAKNNVIATNVKGDTLKTEHLIWEENTEKIYTEEYVKIIRTDQIITGIGFQSDQSLENWRIKNPKGTIYITPENRQDNDPFDTLTTPAVKQEPIDLS
ncbi:MAG: LPS export ABC transporter periplasmic protein LptC, partial [Prolixibacteraceae bacterium]|nr:LPS export ABC transporter periplasmic protein LptC [Prolixibacteraceae bacterium]